MTAQILYSTVDGLRKVLAQVQAFTPAQWAESDDNGDYDFWHEACMDNEVLPDEDDEESRAEPTPSQQEYTDVLEQIFSILSHHEMDSLGFTPAVVRAEEDRRAAARLAAQAPQS